MKLIQIILTLLSLVFLGYALVSQWELISHLEWQVNYTLLLGSLFALVILCFLVAFGWHLILKSLGVTIHAKASITIWIFSSVTRYLPGFIWAYANRIIWTKKYGVSMVRGSTSMVMENLLMAVASLLVGLPALATTLNFKNNFILIAFLIIGMALSLHPTILSLLRFIPGKIGQKFKEIEYPSFTKIIYLLLYYILLMIFFSLAFVWLAASLFNLTSTNLLVLATSFPASFGIGFILFIFPAGIGAREATLYAILTGILPTEAAILILALGSRIWLITGELLTLAIATLFIKPSRETGLTEKK